MTRSHQVTVGDWWRFDRYEVRNGLIRPAEGAGLERYDPWGPGRGVRAGQPAYSALLNLAQGLEFQPRPGPGPLRELTPDSAERLERWCGAHGLLGLLPHQLVMASRAPSWEPLEGNEAVLVPTQLQYMHADHGWTSYHRMKAGHPPGSLRDRPERRGEPIPLEQVPSEWPRSGVILRSLDSSLYREESFASTWCRFFPDVPRERTETYPYPRPLSDPFWQAYAEPVDDFADAAGLLLRAVTSLGAMGSRPKASTLDRPSVGQGIDLLHSLVRTVGPAIASKGNGVLRQRWASTSLLGSFAMMALLDLTESRRILTCKHCGKVFVSRAYQAAYCSERCRFTAQKRRHRARKKAGSKI